MNIIKNVVIVNDFDYVQGGASKVAIDTANLLARDKNINVYFFSGDSCKTSDLSENVRRICTNTGECLKDKNRFKGILNGLYNNTTKREMKKLLNKLDPRETIVHFHGWTKCLSSSVFDVVFKLNYPNVITLHEFFTACPNGGFFNYPKNRVCKLKGGSFKCACTNCDSRNYFFKIYRLIRFYIQNNIIKLNRKLNNIIYISNFSWSILKDNFNKDVSARLIYNPIDYDTNLQNSIIKKGYFLYVGRVSKEKGVNIFCDAVTKANVPAIVVGDGDQKEKLEKMYTNISFVGWKNNDEVKEYMRNAKALVFPSLWYETAGLTALEARSVGTSTIVSSNTAAVEFVGSEKNIFKQGDVNDLVRAITNFKDEGDDFNFKIFSYDNYLKNIINEYEVIINENNKKD